MLILPGSMPIAPAPETATVARQAPAQVLAVAPKQAGAQTRNEPGADSGGFSGGQPKAKLAPMPDPDAPTGPPPAFKANVLEAERERQMSGRDRAIDTPPENAQHPSDAPHYATPHAPGAHDVDIAL